MRWQQGRAEIDRMLADGDLERVRASREHADRLLNQARRHLESAEATCQSDPEGAYGTLYDAGRKALWAVWPTKVCGRPAGAATSPSIT